MTDRFDLDKALAAWRCPFEHDRAFSDEDVEELESGLRDRIDALVAAGASQEAAFDEALAKMGSYGTAEAEYRKTYWGSRRRRGELLHELRWRLSMLKNYLTVALRTLRRQKGYALLNLAGLTLGMACCLLIFQYVAFEISFDRFHEKQDRIVRAVLQVEGAGGTPGYAYFGAIFGPTMAQEVPGIARSTSFHPNYGDAALSYRGSGEDRTFKESGAAYVDTSFLRVFDFPLVQGDPATALNQPRTMLMTERMARKYFGAEEPLGKTLEFTGWVQGTYTVTGVLEDVPPTSHLQFDILLPAEDLFTFGPFQGMSQNWLGDFVTYFELDENADASAVEAMVTERYRQYRKDDFASNGLNPPDVYLQPLADVHLYSKDFGAEGAKGDPKLVYFFTVIGLITLVIALVNYVNLATARAMDRAREVGVRKVVGARKQQLVSQFLTESALLCGLALGLAVALSLVLLPVVNDVAGAKMPRSLWLDVRFWLVFLGVFGVGALLSGLYPAFVLSSFQPVTVLKGKAGPSDSRVALRKALVVAQFAASIALLAGTAIVYTQLSHMRGLDTGMDLEQVIVVEAPRLRAQFDSRGSELATLTAEIRTLPSVQAVGTSTSTPGKGFDTYAGFYRTVDGPTKRKNAKAAYVGEGFADVYGLELVTGEPFHGRLAVPDSGARPALVNETLVRELGFPSSDHALNQVIAFSPDRQFQIRGVLEDFHWSSAHVEVEPIVLVYSPSGAQLSGDKLNIRANTAGLPQTLAAIEERYKERFPGSPFVYSFADAAFDEQYRADQRFATLFAGFAGIAILIACLGLFGLASFTAARRTKEIGVRKVLGASVGSLVALLSREFLVLIGIAFVLAVPLAYLYMDGWLAGFAYRIEIGPGVFALTGLLVLGIALATVSYQAIRAALADPVESLRYE